MKCAPSPVATLFQVLFKVTAMVLVVVGVSVAVDRDERTVTGDAGGLCVFSSRQLPVACHTLYLSRLDLKSFADVRISSSRARSA
jgi:hypothetical protein